MKGSASPGQPRGVRDFFAEVEAATSDGGQTRRYRRSKEALTTTLAQEGTQSFEAPANRGVRTRVKTNTDTQSGAPRPGMRTAGIRPGAELKSNETSAVEAEEMLAAQLPSIRKGPGDARAEGRGAGTLQPTTPEVPAVKAERTPLRREPLVTETRDVGRPLSFADEAALLLKREAPQHGNGAQWGWVAAMVLAIAALAVSMVVAFGR